MFLLLSHFLLIRLQYASLLAAKPISHPVIRHSLKLSPSITPSYTPQNGVEDNYAKAIKYQQPSLATNPVALYVKSPAHWPQTLILAEKAKEEERLQKEQKLQQQIQQAQQAQQNRVKTEDDDY